MVPRISRVPSTSSPFGCSTTSAPSTNTDALPLRTSKILSAAESDTYTVPSGAVARSLRNCAPSIFTRDTTLPLAMSKPTTSSMSEA